MASLLNPMTMVLFIRNQEIVTTQGCQPCYRHVLTENSGALGAYLRLYRVSFSFIFYSRYMLVEE